MILSSLRIRTSPAFFKSMMIVTTAAIARHWRVNRRAELAPYRRRGLPPYAVWRSGAVFEAPGLVAGFDDLAVLGQAVEECCGHLRVAEDGRPFGECEVGGDDNRGAFVEAADEMEEQLSTGLCEGQTCSPTTTPSCRMTMRSA
jgi:hypothetical protein